MTRIASVAALLLLLTSPGYAVSPGPNFGFGASGGLTIPIAQDDQGSGAAFGLRAMMRPVPMIGVEAFLNFANYGDPELDIAGVTNDLEGSKVTAYGVEGMLGGGPGLGPRPFFTAGLGFFDTSRDQTEAFDEDGAQFGYTLGLGLGFGLTPQLGLDARARFNIIPIDDGGSDKSLFLLGSLNFYLGN